jgi:uncharacterized protein YjbJ (UPF0337 family)
MRGRLEEQVGKLAKDRELEAKGKLEAGAGKVQEKIGQAEKLLGA